MDLEQITREYKRNLRRASHGGEIYRINKHEDERFLDFSTNINPIFDVAKYSHIIQENLKQITKYPDSNSLQLKKALIKSISNVVSEENILIGAGAMDIIATFCDVFIDPGDEVIIAQPTFAEYQWAIEKNGGQVVHYHRIPEKNFNLTPKDLLNHVTPKTKAIFICNPNNPNGNLDENDSIRKIMNEASKLDIVVFLDEAFIEFTGTEEYFINHLGDFDNLVICRSFTKFYAIPGLRVGYGVSSPQIIEILERNHNLWSTNFIGQLLVQEMLMDNDLKRKTVEFFTRERQFLSSELKKIPQLKIFDSHTNFLLIKTKQLEIQASKLKDLMLQENILIRDCSNYEGLTDYYFRICINSHQLNLKFIESFNKVISEFQTGISTGSHYA